MTLVVPGLFLVLPSPLLQPPPNSLEKEQRGCRRQAAPQNVLFRGSLLHGTYLNARSASSCLGVRRRCLVCSFLLHQHTEAQTGLDGGVPVPQQWEVVAGGPTAAAELSSGMEGGLNKAGDTWPPGAILLSEVE